MTRADSTVVFYPAWLKLAYALGVPLLTLVALWLVSRPFWEEGLTTTQFLVGLLMGFALLYGCFLGLLALRSLTTEMAILDEGLEIRRAGSVRLVPWHSLALKEYPFAGVVRLAERNGGALTHVFAKMVNLTALKHRLREEDEPRDDG